MAVVTVTSVSVILMLQVMLLCDTSQTSCIHIILHGKNYAFEQLKIFTGLGCNFSALFFLLLLVFVGAYCV